MEKIYMIPVNDAYNEHGGCPVCRLRDKAENNYLEYYLGPSLMEPDTRKITNTTGFCPVHMGKLNKAVTNRLGLGLVMHTHLKDFNEENINTVKQDQQHQKLIIQKFLDTVKEVASTEALLCQLCVIFICVLNYTFY